MDKIKDKTILVTGGTGFIGRALCAQLAARGAVLYILTRKKRAPTGAATYIQSLADIPPGGVDIIINLAGAPISQRWTPAARHAIRDSRIVTTNAIVDFIQRSAHKPQLLISASAIGYYGTSEDALFEETTPPVAAESFAATLCHEWENSALPASKQGVRTVLLRIGVVLGKDGGVLKKLLPPFKFGLGGRLGSGRQWFSWIDRDDLIKLCLFIIENDDIDGPVNATAPHPVTNQAFTTALARALKRPAFANVPAIALRLGFGQMAEEIMLKGQRVVPAKALAHGFVFDFPQIKKSLEKIVAA